jgi:hypothetical protein
LLQRVRHADLHGTALPDRLIEAPEVVGRTLPLCICAGACEQGGTRHRAQPKLCFHAILHPCQKGQYHVGICKAEEKLRKILLWLLAALLLIVTQSDRASACACCTNPAQRYVGIMKMQPHQLDLVRSLKFAKQAELYLGEGDLGEVKGIANPTSNYELAVADQENRLVFSFRDGKKNEGTLTLALTDTISIFEVDPRDPKAPKNGLGPSLYKEWRLTAPLSGTGIFSAGNGGYQRMTLIFHGRGRGCTEASHFNAWSLYIHGPLGNYLFFGNLDQQ